MNIAIFYGGKSVEHDISVITALQTMNNMPSKYNVYPIYIKADGKFVYAKNLNDGKTYLNFEKNVDKESEVTFSLGRNSLLLLKNNKIKKEIKIDCALLCNHGHGGEDGCLQGLLELCEIPYTSCTLPSSAITMDKVLTKLILISEHIDTPKYVQFDSCEYKANSKEILKKIKKELSYPCIIKPSRCGSSVGISIGENEDMTKSAIEHACNFDDKIIVEEFIKNAREFCCAVIKNGNKFYTSNVQEVTKGEFYTFEEKYLKEKDNKKSDISKELVLSIKEEALKSYKALSCDGVVRVDFLYDGDKLYVNEVNSIPGSLAFHLFNGSFGDLINTLIDGAIERYKNKKDIVYSFNSSAIENFINMTKSQKGKP